MELKNQGQFDRFTAEVFLALADAFPKPIDIGFEELGLVEGPAYDDREGFSIANEYTPLHEFGTNCVRFLHSEGYLAGNVHNVHATAVVLTAKGLELLSASFDSLSRSHY